MHVIYCTHPPLALRLLLSSSSFTIVLTVLLVVVMVVVVMVVASPKVSQRCFGARLMLEPDKVRSLVWAMARRAAAVPITVKCRIGADERDS